MIFSKLEFFLLSPNGFAYTPTRATGPHRLALGSSPSLDLRHAQGIIPPLTPLLPQDLIFPALLPTGWE